MSHVLNDASALAPALPPAPTGAPESAEQSSRLPTADLNNPIPIGCTDKIALWSLRPAQLNDHFLRTTFEAVLAESAAAPPDERLVMYDANDGVPSEVLGVYRKRLDPRRNTKPKKPGDQKLVCTPFDERGFHFGKIKNAREKLLQLQMEAGAYELLTNKFPLFPKHMLLVCKELVPQQLRLGHIQAISELLQASSFCAYFNSWCASASVNHFHCHLIDDVPMVAQLPLVPGPRVGGVRCLVPDGFHGFCYVFEAGPTMAEHLSRIVCEMQADNQPHNLLFMPHYVYVWPKPLERPARSFELYPETVGGPELLGSFTVYGQDWYDQLSADSCAELVRMNTAPLPSRLLQHGLGLDDDAVHAKGATPTVTQRAMVPASRSSDSAGSTLNTWSTLLDKKPFPTRVHGKSRSHVASYTTAR